MAKGGVAAPESHPLRLAVSRHRARLAAELTKARLRRGFASIEQLRTNLEEKYANPEGECFHHESVLGGGASAAEKRWIHPRWIRINTLRTTLDAQLKTTFDGYILTDSIEEITKRDTSNAGEKLIHIDRHIPNLVAIAASARLSKSYAYLNGLIIFQDKASCFPAYLLDPKRVEGEIIDACAAPGNKTTHLAMLLQGDITNSDIRSPTILACELDKWRSATLQAMVAMAGAQNLVTVWAEQDFIKLNHQDEKISSRRNQVGSLLLDPSCSGSGIVGRDEVVPLHVVFPEHSTGTTSATPTPTPTPTKSKSLKRKRKEARQPTASNSHKPKGVKAENLFPNTTGPFAQNPYAALSNNEEAEPNTQALTTRLAALQTFQLKLLVHAFTAFPTARKIIYSTCSLHAEENEHVVLRALTSPAANEGEWRILRREEQVDGARRWGIRGNRDAAVDVMGDLLLGNNENGKKKIHLDEIVDACIRCEKGTMEGTQGFFVAGFIRDHVPTSDEGIRTELLGAVDNNNNNNNSDLEGYESWEGITDDE